jgi:hypothetical protein
MASRLRRLRDNWPLPMKGDGRRMETSFLGDTFRDVPYPAVPDLTSRPASSDKLHAEPPRTIQPGESSIHLGRLPRHSEDCRSGIGVSKPEPSARTRLAGTRERPDCTDPCPFRPAQANGGLGRNAQISEAAVLLESTPDVSVHHPASFGIHQLPCKGASASRIMSPLLEEAHPRPDRSQREPRAEHAFEEPHGFFVA